MQKSTRRAKKPAMKQAAGPGVKAARARLARQVRDVAQAAPQVVAMRLARMAEAGPAPNALSARDRREFARMGTEKLAAWGQAWQAMALHALVQQQQWLNWYAGAYWQWAAGGWMRPWATAGRLARQAGQQGEKAALELASQGLEPVRRRASANARRLRKQG